MVVKGEEYAISRAMGVGFKILIAFFDGAFESREGVLRPRLMITPMRKGEQTRVVQKSLHRRPGRVASAA